MSLLVRSSVKKIERSGCNPIRAADSQEAPGRCCWLRQVFFIWGPAEAGNLSSVSSTGQSRSTPFNGFGVHLKAQRRLAMATVVEQLRQPLGPNLETVAAPFASLDIGQTLACACHAGFMSSPCR